MSLFRATGAPERLQFFDGQRLFASDLEGLAAFHREMRRLHLSTLHEPGIAAGFAVAGEEGDRTVRIGPGYAIDDLGREIVLVEEREEPVPAVAGEPDGTPTRFDLTVEYRDDDLLERAEERKGLCGTRGVVRLREEPVFCWVRLGEDGQPIDDRHKHEIFSGRRLTVARAEVLECKLRSRLSIAERFSARPPTQPFIASGRTEPRWLVATDPEPRPLAELCLPIVEGDHHTAIFALVADSSGTPSIPSSCLVPLPIDVYARIDTRCAGFRTTPCYWARIEGPRLIATGPAGEHEGRLVGYLDALIRIEEPTATSFEIHLTPVFASFLGQVEVSARSGEIASQPVICQILEWAVVWKGVEG
jgi:hypothetical protein